MTTGRKPRVPKGDPCPGQSCKTCEKHARCRTEAKALRDGYDPIEVYCDDWKAWTKEAEDAYKRGSVVVE